MLQQTVQVLKAHRNLFFKDDDPNRASSIVITATAAKAYQGESTLYDAVMHAAARMAEYIESDGASYVVLNPAHDRENFADLWTDARATRFVEWVDDLQRTLEGAALSHSGLPGVADALSAKFGHAPVVAAIEGLGTQTAATRDAGRLAVSSSGALGVSGLAVKRHTFYGK